MNDAFHTTQWTKVLAARGQSTAAGDALKDLCGNCYSPVLAFLERSPHTAPEAADLAHGFFEWLLSRDPFAALEPGRGRFRSYLLGALKHYLSREVQSRHRLKRGGPPSQSNLPPDSPAGSAEHNGSAGSAAFTEPTDPALPPDREFDRQWALHLLRQAMDRLSAEVIASGRETEWKMLLPFLTGETTHGSLSKLAADQGLPESTLRSQLHRLRQRFRHHIRAAITPTLASPGEVPDEMSALLAALSH